MRLHASVTASSASHLCFLSSWCAQAEGFVEVCLRASVMTVIIIIITFIAVFVLQSGLC